MLSVGGPAAHSAGLPVLRAPVAVEVCRGEENVHARRGNIFFTCGSKYYKSIIRVVPFLPYC